MKYLALFLIINSVAWSQTPHYQGQDKKTKPLLERDRGQRHVPDEDAQHHEAGPKGREAQEAAKKGNPG